MLTPVDVWAASAAFLASCAFGVRRWMLHPQFNAWAGAPGLVQAAVGLQSIVMGMAALHILAGFHAAAREAAAYSAIACAAVVMAWNLHRSGRVGA